MRDFTARFWSDTSTAGPPPEMNSAQAAPDAYIPTV